MKFLEFLFYVLTLTVIFMFMLGVIGCTQRICEYSIVDPNGVVTNIYRYKSNHIATDTTADYVKVVTPNGTQIEFNKFQQDNDSVKLLTPYGTLETSE